MATDESRRVQAEIAFDTSDAVKAMTELSKKTKSLSAEMKLNDAEMKRDGETVDGLKKKQQLLKQQIAAQEDTIKKVTREYEKAVKAKGEDSKEAQLLKSKLIALKTTLVNQQTELNATNKKLDSYKLSLDKVKTAIINVKNAVANVGEKFKAGFNLAKDVVDGIWQTLSNMVAKTWDITINAATNYDDAATKAATLGVSYEEYARTAYASQTSDISPEDYYKAFSKFETLFNTGSQEDIDNLREVLGLTEEAFAEYQQMLDGGDWLGVFEDILANGEGLTNEQLQKMFGEESVKKLQTVLGDNWEAFANRRDSAFEMGVVLTIDQQQSLIALSDSWATLQQNIEGLQSNIGAAFAVEFEPIISDTASLVGSLSKVIQDSFGEDSLDIEAIAASVSEWLPKILGDGAGILRVAKIWVDLINGLLTGSLDGLFDNPEMQDSLEEWGEAWGDLMGDEESGLTGLWKTINEKVLVPLWTWITEKIGELAALIWDAIVQILPDSVRGHLGIQTTEEKEITEEYNAEAADVIPQVIEEMIQPQKRQMSAIERAEYLEGNQFNVGGIEVNVKASDTASADEIGEVVAKKIQQALNDLNRKGLTRTVGGGGGRVRVSN